jgi:hypothetical protein
VKQRSVQTALAVVAGSGLAVLSIAFLDDFARIVVTLALGAFIFARTYRWHWREIRAGRREPVFFGKGKHYPPANSQVPFGRAITELGQNLERHPWEGRTN